MTDKENSTPEIENDAVDTPQTDDVTDYSDDLDVASALAAVSSLGEIAEAPDVQPALPLAEDAESADAEPAADESAMGQFGTDDGAEPADVMDASAALDEADAMQEAEIHPVAIDEGYLDADYTEIRPLHPDDAPADAVPHETAPMAYSAPPTSRLYRGQAASVVPALALIGTGAALTFLLTTTEFAITGAMLLAGGVIGLGVALLAYWVTSGRWAQGSFFVGVLLILEGAIGLYLAQPISAGIAIGWPLFISGGGLALLFALLFAAPFDARALMMSLVLIVTGGAVYALQVGIIPPEISTLLPSIWPIAPVILVVILITAFVRSRRS